MRRYIVAGNWKMHTTLTEATDLAAGLRERISGYSDIERVLIPPYPWILPVRDAIAGTDIHIGAQNCYTEPSGAFTGEVSAEMLSAHCSYIIVGHSERRHTIGETNDLIASKVSAVLRAGPRVILCVGETLEEREAGRAERVVSEQVKSALAGRSEQDLDRVVIAYEPVWAIGTGVAASAADAQEMCAFVRSLVDDLFSNSVAGSLRVQYGGSVKGSNAEELLSQPDIDGALVGGASLDADEFAAIVRSASAQVN